MDGRNTAAGFSQLLEYGYYSSGNISIVRDNVNGSNYEVRYSYDKLLEADGGILSDEYFWSWAIIM